MYDAAASGVWLPVCSTGARGCGVFCTTWFPEAAGCSFRRVLLLLPPAYLGCMAP
jgi:hypothetical protein